jgi:RimJ/RimL family protein N-acetyltransferase
VTETLETARLVLRRPVASDAHAIFAGYASDPEVTKYLSWPRHLAIVETHMFLQFSDAEWSKWPAGPLLVFSRADGTLLGGSGLAFEAPYRATTGYVLGRDHWGKGYATEALGAIVGLARSLGVQRLSAICHADHRASWRVMEKCGFEREALLRRHTVFPNLSEEPADVLQYVQILQPLSPFLIGA